MKQVRFLDGDFEMIIKSYNDHARQINNILNRWNEFQSIGVNTADETVFKAVLNNDPWMAFPAFSAVINAIAETQSPIKEVQDLIKIPINERFNSWAVHVDRLTPIHDLISWKKLIKERFLFDNGLVKIDEDAVRMDFTVFMSEKGEELYTIAVDALNKLNKMKSFLEKNGKDIRSFQIIQDDAPPRTMREIMAGGYSLTVEKCFSNHDGVLSINEDFFVDI